MADIAVPFEGNYECVKEMHVRTCESLLYSINVHTVFSAYALHAHALLNNRA